MKKEEKIIYKINGYVLKSYVKTINSTSEPMNQIKENLRQMKSVRDMSNEINELLDKYPKEYSKVLIDTIKQIMNTNNGMLTTRMIEPLNISRNYLVIMKNNGDIERVSRGIYVSTSTYEDSYFFFQQKYKKVIFSHMTALYFYDMTEEFPYNYTVTVPKNYHVEAISGKCNVFYVSKDIYEMGVVEVETPSGNMVRAYDKERCICDIIRSDGRMDLEQVKKTVKKYVQSKDKNITKLSDYAKKMGISDKVMEMVGVYYE